MHETRIIPTSGCGVTLECTPFPVSVDTLQLITGRGGGGGGGEGSLEKLAREWWQHPEYVEHACQSCNSQFGKRPYNRHSIKITGKSDRISGHCHCRLVKNWILWMLRLYKNCQVSIEFGANPADVIVWETL